MHVGTLSQAELLAVVFCHYELFRPHNTVLSVGVFIFLLLCKLLKLCVYAFISLLLETSQKKVVSCLYLVSLCLYLASLCLCPSVLQISG